MATKVNDPQFRLDIHGKIIGIDVRSDGHFHARTAAGESAKTLEGLQKSLEGKYLPDGVKGIPVQEMWSGSRTGAVVGRAPNEGRRGSYFLVRWKGKTTSEIVNGDALMHVETAEHKAKLQQLEDEMDALDDAIEQKNSERDAYVESLCAKDFLDTAFPKRKR